jgi:hypothetical protein
MASECTFVSPSGSRCIETALSDGKCFWHAQTDKRNPELKSTLENKARKGDVLAGYCLAGMDLSDVYLIEADLSSADLSRANLSNGHLFGINFSHASLFKANLREANLKEANLENANLLGADVTGANLERVVWGKGHKVQNHLEADDFHEKGLHDQAMAKYLEAEEIYRNIRKCYEAAGTSDVAGYFFYNEMVTRRKQMPPRSFERFWSWLIDLLCGYGEIPYRIIGSSIAYVLINALVFSALGLSHNNQVYTFERELGLAENLEFLGYAVYFSVVTFTTLGYGDFAPLGWARAFAAIEAFVGVFMIALFVVSFVKKMTR